VRHEISRSGAEHSAISSCADGLPRPFKSFTRGRSSCLGSAGGVSSCPQQLTQPGKWFRSG
jgi:hypothetical protein